jgi:hypothetical protein
MKNILQGIGIVFTLIASFLGLMYTLKGDVLISSLVSLVIIVIEYFLIEKFIQSKSEITKNKFSTLSIVLWSVYTILAIPISVFLLHALNVEINAKSEIKNVANNKIQDLTNMSKSYRKNVDKNVSTLSLDLDNTIRLYSRNSSSSLESKLIDKPFNLSSAQLVSAQNGEIEAIVRSFVTAKTKKLASVADTVEFNNANFINRYSGVFDGWSRLDINYAFYELDDLLKKNYDLFIKNDSAQMSFASDRFKFEYKIEDTNMDKPLLLFNEYKPYYLILIVLLFHFLILLPYIIEETSGSYAPKSKDKKGGGRKI